MGVSPHVSKFVFFSLIQARSTPLVSSSKAAKPVDSSKKSSSSSRDKDTKKSSSNSSEKSSDRKSSSSQDTSKSEPGLVTRIVFLVRSHQW